MKNPPKEGTQIERQREAPLEILAASPDHPAGSKERYRPGRRGTRVKEAVALADEGIALAEEEMAHSEGSESQEKDSSLYRTVLRCSLEIESE